MDINKIILIIMAVFMSIGALDKVLGSKYGYGDAFDEGFKAIGPLALALVGMLSLSPVIATVLEPIIVPIYEFLGADPSMFASTILAYDMGGYDLAMTMANTPDAGTFSGLLHGSMMGVTIAFTIPFSLRMVEKKDYSYLAKGILSGIVTIPLGCVAGGLIAGFDIGMIITNLLPIFIVAIVVSIGLWKIPEKMIVGFKVFGYIITVVVTVATAAIGIETLTGFIVIPGMNPIEEGLQTAGIIGVMLAGAFPMIHFIKKVFGSHLEGLGNKLKINGISATGLLLTLANSVPMFASVKDMDKRGKVINIAFAVSASFAIGGNLAFAAGKDASMIFPVVAGKLIGGITAIILAVMFTRREKVS